MSQLLFSFVGCFVLLDFFFKRDLEIKPLNKKTSQQNKTASHGKYSGITTANVSQMM